MRHRIAIAIVVATTCAAVHVGPVATAEAKSQTHVKTDLPGEDAKLYSCRKAKGKVSVRFKPEVYLKDLLSWAMGFTCKNFVFSSRIVNRKAMVTIIAPKKMTAREAYRVFLVALQSMTLTVVPKGTVLEIVEAPQAKKHSVPLYRFSQPSSSDQIVRMVLRPKHIPVDDVARALGAMRSMHGDIQALPSSGVLLVTDYGSHISKMVRLMRELDRPLVRERLYLIKVRNIPVKDMAQTLNEVFAKNGATQPAPRRQTRRRRGRRGNTRQPSASTSGKKTAVAAVPSKIITVERTSSLILLATKPAFLRAKAIVDRVDIAVGNSPGRSMHVYYVSNGDAEKISKTLAAVIQGAKPDAGASNGRRRTQPRTTPTSTVSPSLEGDVRVTHDETTNALVVAASLRDYHSLLQVIKKLDQPRRQVFIEAVIMEVKVGNTRTLGTSYHGGSLGSDGTLVLGGVEHKELNSIASIQDTASNLSGLIAGITGNALTGVDTLLGVSVPSFNVMFQALATVSNINVLSTPHVTTVNNVPAVISVGEKIPTKSSFTGTTTSTSQFVPTQNVKYEDIDLELKITPHVNKSGVISMDVDLSIAELSAEDMGGLGPSWAKRKIQTTVVMNDQESVVIGGLMKDKSTVTESKVPVLGDLPVLGTLFRHKYTTKEKSNLLVILTPYILKDRFDRRRVTARKMRERQEFVRTMSSFNAKTPLPKVDFRRKRGLIEQINQDVKRVEREAKILREMNKTSDDVKEGRID